MFKILARIALFWDRMRETSAQLDIQLKEQRAELDALESKRKRLQSIRQRIKTLKNQEEVDAIRKELHSLSI